MWESKLGRMNIDRAFVQTPQGLKQVRDFYSMTPDGLKRWKPWTQREFDPNLGWKRLYAKDFGLSDNTLGFTLYDNGKAISINHYQDRNHVYDFTTKKWVPSNMNNVGYGVVYAGNGIFIMAKDRSQSILASADGINWSRGVGWNSSNGCFSAASDGKHALAGFWWDKTPLFYSDDVLGDYTWQLVGSNDGNPNPYPMFEQRELEYYNGYYIGISSKSVFMSRDRFNWIKFAEPNDGMINSFSNIKKVHDKLYVMAINNYIYGQTKPIYTLCLINEDISDYRVLLQGEDIPNLASALYLRKYGVYLMFGNNGFLLCSRDGETWSRIAQKNFTGSKQTSVYIPNDGIYVVCSGSYWDTDYVYYAACA